MSERATLRVLFVCMGNICRSPTAEGVFRKLLEREGLGTVVGTDSAGTHGYHVGEPPDRRARQTALCRGIDLGDQRARQITPDDFARFEYVLAMDEANYRDLAEICPRAAKKRLMLFMDFAPHLRTREVPDPYYGGRNGFEAVLDMVEAASEGLLADIKRRYL